MPFDYVGFAEKVTEPYSEANNIYVSSELQPSAPQINSSKRARTTINDRMKMYKQGVKEGESTKRMKEKMQDLRRSKRLADLAQRRKLVRGGGKRQIIDLHLYDQVGGNADELTSELLAAFTKDKPDDEKDGLRVSSEDANNVIDIAKNIISKQTVPEDETDEEKTSRLADIQSLNNDMREIINKYIDEADPIITESKISATNTAISRVQRKCTPALIKAMQDQNADEKTRVRELMQMLQIILEVTKAVRDMAEAKIQALTSDEGKCLMTADLEGRTPGMYPMTEFEDELMNDGFIVRVDTGSDSDKNVCTFERLIIDPSTVRDNLCRICFPVVMQTNSNHAFSLRNNSFVANKLRVFLPEGKRGGEDLAIKIYGMNIDDYVTKQQQGLIKAPPQDEEEDGVVSIPHYVCTGGNGWDEGDSLIVGKKVFFPKTLSLDPDEPAVGIVSSINLENETVILEPEEATEVVVEGPTEIAISEIRPRFVKVEDFKDKNGRTFFMHDLEKGRIGQAATDDIYIKLRTFMDFGGIISLEEIYKYVVEAAVLRKKKGSAFRQPLKFVKVSDSQLPIASFKLTEPTKVSNFIDDILYGGELMDKILAPMKASKGYVNDEDKDELIIEVKNRLIQETDKIIQHDNASEPFIKRIPTLTKYLDTFNVVSASHCQDGQTETLYKIQLSQEQQDEWDAYRKISDLSQQLDVEIEELKGELRKIAKEIKAAGAGAGNDADTLLQQQTELKSKSTQLAEQRKAEGTRLTNLRKKLSDMFLEDGGKKLSKNAGPSLKNYQNYKNELTLPDAEIQYKDAIVETLQQLTNNSPDYEDRSVNYEELFAELFCIPDYPRYPYGDCQKLPRESGPLRLFASWLANQFLCLKPDPDNPREPPGRYYRPEDSDKTIKQVLEALEHFEIIKKRSYKRIKGPFDDDYVFADDYKYLNDNWKDPIGVFVDGEYDSIAHDVVNETDEYIKNILKKNYVTFKPNKPITEENCVELVADPKNYKLTEYEEDTQPNQSQPNTCPVLGEDRESGVTLPATFGAEECTDLMCEVYRRYNDILINTDDYPVIPDDLMPEEILNIMIQKGTAENWLLFINRDPDITSNDAAMEELKSMITHIVECMQQGTQCRYNDIINSTCSFGDSLGDISTEGRDVVVRALFSDSEDSNHSLSGLGQNCFAARDSFDYDGNVPSNWDEDICGELICAVKEEYDAITDSISSEARMTMTIPEWINQIIELWSQSGANDPTDYYLERIRNAPEIAELEDPATAARQKLAFMMRTIIDCLIDGSECVSYNHINTECSQPAESFSAFESQDDNDSFDQMAAAVAENVPQGSLGSLSPINSVSDIDTMSPPTTPQVGTPMTPPPITPPPMTPPPMTPPRTPSTE